MEGLGHVPSEGGFVLVPNHTSYLDHFVLAFLLEAVRDERTWFLTKQESFEKPLIRAWTLAWRGIPVDRDRPSAETLRRVQAVLREGDVLCVYPEGTRNPNPRALAEFKSGGFHFAATANVPIVPVVIVGADQVLPKQSRTFRRGRIDVRFGPAIIPDASVPKPERVRSALTEARAFMEAALAEMNARRSEDEIDANGLTARTTALLNRGQLTGERARSLAFIVRAMQQNNPKAVGPIKARARLTGLTALTLPAPLKGMLLARSEAGLRRAVRLNPEDADAHYYLGTALAAHRKTRGDACEHFEIAAQLTDQQDPRPLLALASEEARAGHRHRAQSLLEAAARVLDERDERTPAREQRIANLRRELELRA